MPDANGGDGDHQRERFPGIPPDCLGEEWTLTTRAVSTVFRLPTAEVRDHRLVYEDADLRDAVREATDGALDQPWRIFFASRLSFLPPLASGIGATLLQPMVETESGRAYADELRERGFENVERGRRQRMPTEYDDRTSLMKYTADFAVDVDGAPRDVDIEGWLAVWTRDGTFRVAGGAYPTRGLSSVLDDETVETGDFREELLALIRRVR